MPEEPTPSHPTAPPTQPAGSEASAATSGADTAPAATPATGSLPEVPAAAPAVPDTGYTAAGVPTFDGVREKIESRFGTALGATELAEETREGRTAAQQYDARQKAAEEKLAEIRASMHKPE